ncbi:MAG: sigma 54-interacting transcriptional regulator [Deltaproteobacteria bacterium]|nr:sigma 54-interacting transcriptional regulator [Deltaproteobacteria bacterium]
MEKPTKVEILVVASQEDERRALAEVLEPPFHVEALAPSALAAHGPLVDKAAAIASLNGAEPRAVERLLPIRELFAGRSLILLARNAEEELLEEAIARLDPFQMLTQPVSAPALRLAVLRSLPAEGPGSGAREGHRRARALLGVSAAIREVLEQVRQVAPLQVSVLILGETGTGKELVARAIHEKSPRAQAPFVAVNCSAMPDSLLESELFGYQRGAFTGADRSKRGLFQQASGGTLFLDEVGDTSPALQAKLLRAIEEQEIRPIGAEQTVPVDVRVVSATHCDLRQAMERETFRRDLFYRLNTIEIYVPPLRRRRVDIPFLAQHFTEELGEVHARRITLGEDFVDRLLQHDFPGNVRELRNAVERAIALARPGETVTAEQLVGFATDPGHRPLEAGPAPREMDAYGADESLRSRVQKVELEVIAQALERYDGNRTRVAQALGLSRVGLRQKMRRLGIDTPRRY